jgi:hypothetical protein
VVTQQVQGPAGASAGAGVDKVVSITGAFTGSPTMFATNELTFTAGAIVLTFPSSLVVGSWAIIKFLSGNPSTHNVTINPPTGGATIEGVLGVGADVPGTYYSTLVFNLAEQAGTSIRFYVNSGGNIAFNG